MIEKIKKALVACPDDGNIYLVCKLSDWSGFFISRRHLIYMVHNTEEVSHQSLATEFLRMNTDIDINSIRNNQQFKSGKYNTIEIIPVDEKYDDVDLEAFLNLCIAHTNFMTPATFVKFFYSLVSLFQYPKEQKFINLIGLFGELSFLRYAANTMDIDLSDGWHKSGSMGKYDITLELCNLEIKTTMSTEELVTIKHSQVFNMDRNFIVKVLLEESDSGITLNQLIAEMQNNTHHFKSFAFALNIEKERKRISPIDAETKKFFFKSVMIYDADVINPFQEFPGNVSNVTYQLDLVGLPIVDLKTFEKEINNV